MTNQRGYTSRLDGGWYGVVRIFQKSDVLLKDHLVWLVVSIYFFHPYLGKIPSLTTIFQRVRNHQLYSYVLGHIKISNRSISGRILDSSTFRAASQSFFPGPKKNPAAILAQKGKLRVILNSGSAIRCTPWTIKMEAINGDLFFFVRFSFSIG